MAGGASSTSSLLITSNGGTLREEVEKTFTEVDGVAQKMFAPEWPISQSVSQPSVEAKISTN
jgi:hypothetical protein